MQAYLVLHVLSAQSMSFPSLKTDQRFHLQHFDEICYNNVANILTKYVTLPNRLRPTNDDFVTVFFTCYDYYCLSPWINPPPSISRKREECIFSAYSAFLITTVWWGRRIVHLEIRGTIIISKSIFVAFKILKAALFKAFLTVVWHTSRNNYFWIFILRKRSFRGNDHPSKESILVSEDRSKKTDGKAIAKLKVASMVGLRWDYNIQRKKFRNFFEKRFW